MNPAQLGVEVEATRVCPYDSTHVIAAKSFTYHLMRCRENHKDKRMATCHFDKLHVMPEAKLKHHLKTCPSRYLWDRELQKNAGGSAGLMGDVKGPEIVGERVASDSWDEECANTVTPQPLGLFNRREKNRPSGRSQKDTSYRTSPEAVHQQYDSVEESSPRQPHSASVAAQLSMPQQKVVYAAKSSQDVPQCVRHALSTVGLGRGRKGTSPRLAGNTSGRPGSYADACTVRVGRGSARRAPEMTEVRAS